MENFKHFLLTSKGTLQKMEQKSCELNIVLGNESCDLDSTVSTLLYAYHLYKVENQIFLPIINIDVKLFRTRTLTCHLLDQSGIASDLLLFRNDLDLNRVKSMIRRTYLVDHHVLNQDEFVLKDTVVEIIDHRPICVEFLQNYSNLKKIIVNPVGSCCTLITSEILNTPNESILQNCDLLSYLLYTTIIFDTIGLNPEHGRTTTNDLKIGQILERYLRPLQRTELFNELWTVHNDISQLTTQDLLWKDVKFNRGAPIIALPLLVADFLKNCSNQILDQEFQVGPVVLLGISVENQMVQRDLAIYSKDLDVLYRIQTVLTTGTGCLLDLKEVSDFKRCHMVLFKQQNVKLTRKFILPLLSQYD